MSAAYLRGPEAAPRPERYVGCVGKHAFRDAATARRVAARSEFPLDVYRCKRCNGFHIGNPVPTTPYSERAACIREEPR